ncbi:MAG: hypothetical protein C7B44_14485 [Sulfobacillus thermosulfidooxidans]|nr:MAG: hypothetical protein C7B44_14485 [Sulfobacillus thermosulfidooxidans]
MGGGGHRAGVAALGVSPPLLLSGAPVVPLILSFKEAGFHVYARICQHWHPGSVPCPPTIISIPIRPPPIGGAFTPWIARFSRLNTPLEQATQRMIHQEFACEAERPGSRDGHHAASMASWQRNGPVRNALRPRRADRPIVT